jgi:pantoate--beta-alanine ligase
VALALPAALEAGRAEAATGPAAVVAAARNRLDRAGALVPAGPRPDGTATQVPLAVDYLALVDPGTFLPVPPGFTGTAVLAVAARVGGTRLIDNVPVEFR